MKAELRAVLKGISAISSPVAGRINWEIRPQGSALPALVLTLVGGAPGVGVGGPDASQSYLVQCDIWSKSSDELDAICGAVKMALNGYKSGAFQGIFLEAERTASPDDSDPEIVFGTHLDLRVWFNA